MRDVGEARAQIDKSGGKKKSAYMKGKDWVYELECGKIVISIDRTR